MSATPSVAVSRAKAQAAVQHSGHAPGGDPAGGVHKPAGYGLPCANCRTYYPADLNTCPVCESSERVAVTAPPAPAPLAPSEQLPDPALLAQERERFLREFKVQLTTLHNSAPAGRLQACVKEENHQGGPATAAICLDCYERLQERVDVLEAALQMDLKEAARIVYDAVWADPSDPNKTYENAAHALLTELRKRSGVPHTFALLQPPQAD
jgi:hypothetical protein